MQAVSFHRQWRAYSLDYEGAEKLIFCVKEPLLCFAKKCSLKVQLAASSFNSWDFEINGSFIDRQCTITDHRGKLVAEVMLPLLVAPRDNTRTEFCKLYMTRHTLDR